MNLSDPDESNPQMTPGLAEQKEEDADETEEEPSEMIFENLKGYVNRSDADRISQQGFYGARLDDGRLELEPIEILHLLERKRITLSLPDGTRIGAPYIVKTLLPEDPNLWVKYLVFRDLRSRGYAVRQGFGGGIGFRVYARGDKPGVATAKQLIYVMKEGNPISLHDLNMVTDAAVAARKNLLFALVDQNGEVNYYKVAQTKLRKIGENTNDE